MTTRKGEKTLGEVVFLIAIAGLLFLSSLYILNYCETMRIDIDNLNTKLQIHNSDINTPIPINCGVTLITNHTTNETRLRCDCEYGGCEAYYDDAGKLQMKFEYNTPEYIVTVLP